MKIRDKLIKTIKENYGNIFSPSNLEFFLRFPSITFFKLIELQFHLHIESNQTFESNELLEEKLNELDIKLTEFLDLYQLERKEAPPDISEDLEEILKNYNEMAL